MTGWLRLVKMTRNGCKTVSRRRPVAMNIPWNRKLVSISVPANLPHYGSTLLAVSADYRYHMRGKSKGEDLNRMTSRFLDLQATS